jgi:hypothetical protein
LTWQASSINRRSLVSARFYDRTRKGYIWPLGLFDLIFSLFLVLVTSTFCAEQPDSAVRFSQQSRVFRIDAGETTYVFGVQ